MVRIKCNEGFSFGSTNNEGYSNTYNYKRGMKIDVLVMGSSHMEAHQVLTPENASSVLGRISGLTVYNIGVSAHGFLECTCNIENAVHKYQPAKYIVIETGTVTFPDEKLTMAINNTLPEIGVVNRGTLRLLLRRNRYFVLLWNKFRKLWASEAADVNAPSNSPALLEAVMRRLSEAASSCGAKVIIAYHPSVDLNLDGTLHIKSDPDVARKFSELCSQNGVYFLDMSEKFLREYASNFVLPYGFINTSVGKAHMNKHGHRMFAEEIYSLIQRIEAGA